MKVEDPGTYRATIVDHGVKPSKNGFPMWHFSLEITQQWYPESLRESVEENSVMDENGWVDVSEDMLTAVDSQCLANAKGKLWGADMVMEATGWDGSSLNALAKLDLAGRGVQADFEPDEYQGKIRYRVNRLAAYDAVPGGGGVQKGTAAEIAGLDAAFGHCFAAAAAGAAVAKAAVASKKKATKKAPTKKATKPYTMESAWDAVCKLCSGDEAAAAEPWMDARDKLPDKEDDDLTSDEWADVVAYVKENVPVPAA